MESLCRRIGIPDAFLSAILQADAALPPMPLEGLRQEDRWEETLRLLNQTLAPDPRGVKMLCCMLRCAREAEKDYLSHGISRQVYTDTFACFSRFVSEYRESFGAYGFDRGFWTVRQVSCRLFRIGELEYALTHRDGRPVIELHIPSDIRLELPLLRRSWLDAIPLLERIAPDWNCAPVYCKSWLLSPLLQEFLPENSRILAFQKSFHITPAPSSGGFVQWIYKDPRLAPEQYPENTTLQRNLKAFLLAGNTFLDGSAYLRDDPFL